jgi:flagellar hook-associated protein 1 FlgK
MDAALAITQSALQSAATQIDVAAQNIANTNTPGYVEETAQPVPLPGGVDGVGSGVGITTITQATNTLLSANNNQAQGALSSLTSLQQIMTGLQDAFPLSQATDSAGNPTSTGIAGQLSSFWSSWDGVANAPGQAAPRQGVIGAAQNVANSLNEASTQLNQLTGNTENQLTQQVTAANQLLSSIASLNAQIATANAATGGAAQLNDQQAQDVAQLAKLTGASTIQEQGGGLQVSINGITVVEGATALRLAVTSTVGASGGTTWGLQTNQGTPVNVQSGTTAGLVSGLNTYIPQYLSDINGVASNLVTTVNAQLASGYDAAGTSGSVNPLFVTSGTTAGTIAVNPAVANNPNLLAASDTTGAAAANNGANAQTMAELANSTTGPDANYQTLIEQLGTSAQAVNNQVNSQAAVAQQTKSSLNAATGVNQDAELTRLLSYQQSYQAAAKVLTIDNTAVQALLSAVQ